MFKGKVKLIWEWFRSIHYFSKAAKLPSLTSPCKTNRINKRRKNEKIYFCGFNDFRVHDDRSWSGVGGNP